MNELEELLHRLYIDEMAGKTPVGDRKPIRMKQITAWENAFECFRVGNKNRIELPPKDPTRNVWIWSDTHFGHNNIIRYSGRPYPNLELMTECMVANFNQCVGKDDISIWVGDVGFGNTNRINEVLDQCNGYKILVMGNHDFDRSMHRKELHFDEIHMLLHIKMWDADFVFTHYPFNEGTDGTWHNIYGHVHEMQLNIPNSTCVCVEQPHINYRPIRLFDLYKMINGGTVDEKL